MKNIQEKVLTTYNQNLEYLAKSHPSIYKKISAFDNAVENNHYQEKYEFVYENNGFDVLEKETKNYLYNKESLTHTLIAQNSVDYTLDNSLFEGFPRVGVSKEDLIEYQETNFFTDQLPFIVPIIKEANLINNDKTSLVHLDKFIFFGTGLGLHLWPIHDKIHAKVYYIIEDDLELFRLSLFTCNYMTLAKDSTLIFSVFENEDEFMNTSAIFLDKSYQYNHYIKYHHLLSHNQKKYNQFQVAITSQPHIRFNFTNLLRLYLKPLDYISQDYKILEKTLSFNTPAFKNKPFLVLAMGPSLDKNLDWLKKNHKKFITIGVSSSLSFLEKHSITPDIILHLDPFEWGIQSFEKLKSLSFIENSIALFSTSTPTNIVSLFKKDQLYFYENGTAYKQNSLQPSSPCVGSIAYQILLILEAKDIYILGLDLAVDNITGSTHSQGHHFAENLGTESDNLATTDISYKESLIPVTGNFTDEVLTTPGFYTSIYTINYFTQLLQKDFQSVYNLSTGAKFTKAIPTLSQEINLVSYPDLDDTHTLLKSLFNKHISSTLTTVEKNMLKQKMKHSQKLLQKLTSLSANTYTDVNLYIKQLTAQLTSLEDIQKYELSRVLDTYLKYILHYVYDVANNKETTQEVVSKMIELLNTQLRALIEKYLFTLKEKTF